MENTKLTNSSLNSSARKENEVSAPSVRSPFKFLWLLMALFAGVQVVVSIAVVIANRGPEGFASASFTAMWSMILVIFAMTLSAKIIFGSMSRKASLLYYGFALGTSAALAELFFTITCIFFILGSENKSPTSETARSDKAFAAFSLLNMLLYCIWTVVLIVHQPYLISRLVASDPVKPTIIYKNSGGERALGEDGKPMMNNPLRLDAHADSSDSVI